MSKFSSALIALAIERDRCGDFAEEDRDRCIREARAQRDHVGPSRGAYAIPMSSGSSSGGFAHGRWRKRLHGPGSGRHAPLTTSHLLK
jgi:hypothetical protein